MNQKDKLLLNEGLVFFAFGFALNGNTVLSLITASLAIVLAIEAHSIHALFRCKIPFLTGLVSELIIIWISHLNAVVPHVLFLSVSSLITSVLWLQSSEKVIGNMMRGMTVMMILSCILAFSLNHLYFGKENTLLLVMLIFLPSVIGYLIRECRYYILKKSHTDSRKMNPAVE